MDSSEANFHNNYFWVLHSKLDKNLEIKTDHMSENVSPFINYSDSKSNPCLIVQMYTCRGNYYAHCFITKYLASKNNFHLLFFSHYYSMRNKGKNLRIWQSFWYHGGAGPYYYSIYARWWELKNRLNVEVESFLNIVWWFWCENFCSWSCFALLIYIPITRSSRVY